mgnify:CR=1 FL=1
MLVQSGCRCDSHCSVSDFRSNPCQSFAGGLVLESHCVGVTIGVSVSEGGRETRIRDKVESEVGVASISQRDV